MPRFSLGHHQAKAMQSNRKWAATHKHTKATTELTFSQLLLQHLQLLLSLGQGHHRCLTATEKGRPRGAERHEAGQSGVHWCLGEASRLGYGVKVKAWK